MSFVVAPAVVTTSDQMLPIAHKLLDDETARFYANDNVAVSCQANCNACCNQAVLVTEPETRAIWAAIRNLPLSAQTTISRRSSEIRDRMVVVGLGDGSDITRHQSDFARHYCALSEPCPLLVEGQCAVRSQRPLVCRDYLVSSDPENCKDSSLEHVVRIRRPRNIFSGFKQIAATFDEGRARLLINALGIEPPDAIAAPRSGPKLARLLQGA